MSDSRASSDDWLEASRERLAELEAESANAAAPAAKSGAAARATVPDLLECGRLEQAWDLLPALLAADVESRCTAARIYERTADWRALHDLVEALSVEAPEYPAVVYWRDRRDLLREDFRSVDESLRRRRANGEENRSDRLIQARLHLQLHRVAEAEKLYHDVAEETEASDDPESRGLQASARQGRAGTLLRRLDFENAWRQARRALALTPLDPDLLTLSAHVLIRLGRTTEAIDAAELAVRVAPWHEGAHGLLGNGYARRTYRQLEEEYAAEDLAESRERTLRGASAYAAGEYDRARREFAAALHHCPHYGRAHNGLSRALEARRGDFLIHAEAEREAFEAARPRRAEAIDAWVLRWEETPPHRRRQVDRSVELWAPWIPILAEAGASCYLKPLHELLSQTPGHETLRDVRVQYDARLWDDVRGCGGFHLVAGLEDLDRAARGGADTLLHELTHQVHQVLPRAERRRLEELYRAAAARKAAGEDAFVCRYAGENEWEYFAEGACAWRRPRRDGWDAQEVVRERLNERDPDFCDFLRDLEKRGPSSISRGLAVLRRGEEHLRGHRLPEALEDHRRAYDLARDEPEAIAALARLLQIMELDEALEFAETEALRRPESGELAVVRAEARRWAGMPLRQVRRDLEDARVDLDVGERIEADLHLSQLAWIAGDAPAALRFADEALVVEEDHPEALTARAAALALAGREPEAWQAYEIAARRRNGSPAIHAAWTLDLLRAGRDEDAARRFEVARLLAPEDPDVREAEARLKLRLGEVEAALQIAQDALQSAPWHDGSRAAAARCLQALGRDEESRDLIAPVSERISEEAPPCRRDRDGRGSWCLVRNLPAIFRREIEEIEGGESLRKKPRQKP